jgi:transposase
VYGWLATYRDGGREALRARPVPGRPPKLTGAQLRRLYGLIVGVDPRQLEFPFALWTREMVRTLIRREFTVHLSAVSVGRLLRTLGLSPQRPLWRAWQADPDAVQRWKTDDFPAIRAQAKVEGANDLLRRRGRDPLGLPLGHHLGTGRAHPGREGNRRAARAEHDFRGHRPRADAVLHLHGERDTDDG